VCGKNKADNVTNSMEFSLGFLVFDENNPHKYRLYQQDRVW